MIKLSLRTCCALLLGLAVSTASVPPSAHAATLSAVLHIIPASQTVVTGSGTLAVDMTLDTGGQAVSALSAEVDYSGNLQYVSSDYSGGVLPTVVSSPSASGGVLSFALLRSDTGYTGTGGEVIHMVFNVLSAGGATATIDPNNTQVIDYDSDSILQGVTNGSFTAVAPQVQTASIDLPARSSSQQAVSGIALKFYQAGTSTMVANLTGVTSSSTGAIDSTDSATVNALSDGSTYDLRMYVPGYAPRLFTGLTHLLSQGFAVSNPSGWVAGDFNGDNVITLSDIVIGIGAYNGASSSQATLAKQTFGGTITLGNIVTVIRNYNNDPSGS